MTNDAILNNAKSQRKQIIPFFSKAILDKNNDRLSIYLFL